MDSKPLINASLVGGLLAILGIGLFLLLYIGLGAANVQGAPRLFGALCTPPAVIGLVVGIYSMTRRK